MSNPMRSLCAPALFLGDYTAKGEVTLSIDVQVEFIAFSGNPVPRNFLVELFDDDPFGEAPPAQVWAILGVLPETGLPWTTFSATVSDVLSESLPDAWSDQGNALAGVFGDPLLTGTGTLEAGSANSIDLSNAAQSATIAFFVFFASNPALTNAILGVTP